MIDAALVSGAGPEGPSLRVRGTLLRRPLLVHGVRVHVGAVLPTGRSPGSFGPAGPDAVRRLLAARARGRRRVLHEAGRADTTWILRQVDVLPGLGLERRGVGRSRRVVYDVDDALWAVEGATATGLLARALGGARRAAYLAAAADHVVAGNALLAEWLGAHASRVTVVPSLVDTDAIAVRRHVDGDALVLGWIGSPTTVRYLRAALPGLGEAAGRLGGRRLRLVVVGGRLGGTATGVEVEERPWSPAAERTLLGEMDVGLMPLPDDPWTRGKCAYKALQYMAAGVPVLASPVGVTADVVDGAGILATDAGGWADGVRALADAPLRDRLGRRGRLVAEERFSHARWLPELARILRGD